MFRFSIRTHRNFALEKKPIFTQILSADEINRASPRTQSALLEAMGENQVSVGGDRYALDDLFSVIATQSPIEFHGTHLLPEAQIDRFAMRFSLGYVRAMRTRLRLKRQGTDRSQALSPLIVFCAVLGLNTDKSLVYQPFAFLLYAILIYRFSLRFTDFMYTRVLNGLYQDLKGGGPLK